MIADLRAAFAFLTVIPVGYVAGRKPGYSFTWFPLVGLVIGGLLVLVNGITPLPLRGFILLAVWVAFTGALHIDGFADSADGLLASVSVERRLEIMKDPRTGVFAVTAVGLLLIGKFACLSASPSPYVVLAAPVAARWVMVAAAFGYPYARSGGLGGFFRDGLGRAQLIGATVIAVVVVGAVGVAYPAAWLILIAAPLIVLIGGKWAASRLGGGLTGDVYGALCEVTELIILVGTTWTANI